MKGWDIVRGAIAIGFEVGVFVLIGMRILEPQSGMMALGGLLAGLGLGRTGGE